MEEVRAAIFDYSGVVHREDGADWDALAAQYGLPAGRLWSAFHDIPEYALSRTGRISGPEFRAAVVRAVSRCIDAQAAEALVARVEADDRVHPPIEPEMDDLLRRIAGRVRLGLLTNGGRGALARLEAEDVVSRFDDVVCSGDVGLAKPDPAVYRFAARRLGVATAACLFVDDMERNVIGARAAGMRAHLHHRTRFPDLLRFLEEHGVGTGPTV